MTMSREACATTRRRPATRPESFVTVSGGQYPRVLASCDLVPHSPGIGRRLCSEEIPCRRNPCRESIGAMRMRVMGFWAMVASLLVIWASCTPLPEEGEPGPSGPARCKKNEDCGSGKLCATIPHEGAATKICVASCFVGIGEDVCNEGEYCEDFARDPARGFCSTRCQSDAECGDYLVCNQETGRCECTSDKQCNRRLEPWAGESFTCREGNCTLACETSADCACGSRCKRGACVLGCKDDEDCCGTSSCKSGKCTVPGPAADGSRCNEHTDCKSKICITSTYPRGLCTPDVVTQCKVDSCPSGTACDGVFVGWLDARIGVCAPVCENDGDCRDGMVCSPTEASGPGFRVCKPRCGQNDVCGPGGQCSSASSVCECGSDAWCKTYGTLARCEGSQCVCTPDCRGRECGDDGCGGECGECPNGFACTDDGSCTGSCGSNTPYTVCTDGHCPPNSTCEAGGRCQCNGGYVAETCDGAPCTDCSWEWTCVPCAPKCSGKQCGPDGCGGSCGDCGSGSMCSQGACVPTGGGGGSGGGGGGGDCPGGCPSGTTCVRGHGCITTCSSNGNCSSGCCTPLDNGQRVCADPSYCGTGGGGGSGGGGSGTCHDRTSCISARATYPTGPGHCAGKMIAWMTNNCSMPIYCQWCLGTDCGAGSQIAAGATKGGELGGVWSCGQATGAPFRYVCADVNDPHSCTTFK